MLLSGAEVQKLRCRLGELSWCWIRLHCDLIVLVLHRWIILSGTGNVYASLCMLFSSAYCANFCDKLDNLW